MISFNEVGIILTLVAGICAIALVTWYIYTKIQAAIAKSNLDKIQKFAGITIQYFAEELNEDDKWKEKATKLAKALRLVQLIK